MEHDGVEAVDGLDARCRFDAQDLKGLRVAPSVLVGLHARICACAVTVRQPGFVLEWEEFETLAEGDHYIRPIPKALNHCFSVSGSAETTRTTEGFSIALRLAVDSLHTRKWKVLGSVSIMLILFSTVTMQPKGFASAAVDLCTPRRSG